MASVIPMPSITRMIMTAAIIASCCRCLLSCLKSNENLLYGVSTFMGQ
jgi:hypothetical protein